jgi:hypothetical protein
MTGSPSSGRWTWLLALPVLCCVGHALVLAVGAGSLAAAVGGLAGSAALAAAALLAVAGSAVVMVRRPAPLRTRPAPDPQEAR